MKKIVLYLFFNLCIVGSGLSQAYDEYGINAGATYYQGELSNLLPSSVSYGGGLVYRFNLNYHHSFRFNAGYYSLRGSGNGTSANNHLQDDKPESFNATLLEAVINYEFNFLQYHGISLKYNFSPYITGGGGYSYYLSNPSGLKGHPVFPFGLGVKLNPVKGLTIGSEWVIRKTTKDNIDGIENLSSQKFSPILNNNDWYSFAGIFITLNFYNFGKICPAYDSD